MGTPPERTPDTIPGEPRASASPTPARQPLLLISDVADRLRVTKRSVLRLMAKDEGLRRCRVVLGARMVRIDPDRFERWLKRRMDGALPPTP